MTAAVDVLVVGAGPTGLTLGCELARRGISFRIVDSAPEPSPLSRAIGVQARTLEIFDDMGIAEQAVASGIQLHGVVAFTSGHQIVRASFDELDTQYPFLLSIPQSETERILNELLEQLGASVERGLELVSLALHDDHAEATLQTSSGGVEVSTARWVVGADGAHSSVRRLAGIGFGGAAHDERFLLADVRIDWEVPRDRITTFLSNRGLLGCFPLPDDRWRLIASSDPDEPAELAEAPTLEELQPLVDARSGAPSRLSDPTWLARFHIQCRQVKQYRSGCVFLAGDAAQIHSPAGGQGLNSGIQDAHNLAWKLALVARGQGRAELLDSYHAERHAVGVGLLRGTDFATRVAMLRHPVMRSMRDRMSSFLASLEVVQHRITRRVAELDLSYAGSPIVEEHRSSVFQSRLGADEGDERPTVGAWWAFDSAPRAGERAPDGLVVRPGREDPARLMRVIDGRRHTLLLFDGRAPTKEGYQRLVSVARSVGQRYPDLMHVHIVVPGADRPGDLDWHGSLLMDMYGDLEDRYGARAECLYLLRPDLYVAFRSQPVDGDALLAYLGRIFT
jgi:2-polyprenyl-6-methoxyphenol hydroxylase-like FAD-dependent oxidoreductase